MPDELDDDFGGPTSVRPSFGPEKVVRLQEVRIQIAVKDRPPKRVRMEQPTIIVGKGDDVDVAIDDRSVSRHHLAIEALEDGLIVRDLGSRNGTWLGGCRILEAKVVRDTTFSLGQAAMTIHLEKGESGLEVTTRKSFGGAIGLSPAMRHVFVLLRRAADSEGSVLLEGESGTGKEVLASALHRESARKDQPFVALDCAAIPENLIESELFGHERGAFTGAVRAHVGAFETANGGTIFLDEVGELPLTQQVKLLRVLETHEVKRVGGSRPIPVNVRIVAATNRSLASDVAKKKFRQDLFYRLSVLRIAVPPLRRRKQDIPALAYHFLSRLRPDAVLPPDLMELLVAHNWPGNVRELRNVVERWVTFGVSGPELLLDGRGDPTSGSMPGLSVLHDYSALPYHEAKRRVLEAFDRDYFPRVLARAGGVVTRAAELAGVPRPSFHRMLARAKEMNDERVHAQDDRDDE